MAESGTEPTEVVTPVPTADLVNKIERGQSWQKILAIVAAAIMFFSALTSAGVAIYIAARLIDKQDDLEKSVLANEKARERDREKFRLELDENNKILDGFVTETAGLRRELEAQGITSTTPRTERTSGSGNGSNPSGPSGGTNNPPPTQPPGTTPPPTNPPPEPEPPPRGPEPPPPQPPGPLDPVCTTLTSLGLTICN